MPCTLYALVSSTTSSVFCHIISPLSRLCRPLSPFFLNPLVSHSLLSYVSLALPPHHSPLSLSRSLPRARCFICLCILLSLPPPSPNELLSPAILGPHQLTCDMRHATCDMQHSPMGPCEHVCTGVAARARAAHTHTHTHRGSRTHAWARVHGHIVGQVSPASSFLEAYQDCLFFWFFFQKNLSFFFCCRRGK